MAQILYIVSSIGALLELSIIATIPPCCLSVYRACAWYVTFQFDIYIARNLSPANLKHL
jgi:hypothetical protein